MKAKVGLRKLILMKIYMFIQESWFCVTEKERKRELFVRLHYKSTNLVRRGGH